MPFLSRSLPLVVVLAGLATAQAAPDSGSARTTVTAPSGLDPAFIDSSVRPGDDFFRYANGQWAAKTEIPPDRSAWGAAGELDERLKLQTREILEAAARSNAAPASLERKVGDFYASAMDEAAAESKGIAPLKPALTRIASLKTKADLATWLGEELRADVDAMDCTSFQTSRLFGLWVAPDLNVPTRSVPYLLQGGLGMPDREYFLSTAPTMADTREKYRAHVANIFKLAGVKDAGKRAARVVDLETKMARVHATRLESLEVKNANPWPTSEWAKRAPGLDWTRFFRAAGLSGQPVVVAWHPKATAGLSALVAHEPLDAWK
ncbi:MAG TPA: M13 family metallopeptidase N-terminal domain-containing protein, partial [Myxococcaceae bacterium]